MRKIFYILIIFMSASLFAQQSTQTKFLGTVYMDNTVGTVDWTCSTLTVAKLNADDGTVVAAGNTSGTTVSDYHVKLVVDLSATGNAKTGGTLSTTQTEQSFSQSPSSWGVTLTPTTVNSTNFGCVYAGQSSSITYYIKACNFGFTIPTTGTVIDNVDVRVKRAYTTSCSFIAGTKILTICGEKNIEDVTEQDYVQCYERGKVSYDKVLSIMNYETDTLYGVFVNGAVLWSTADHEYYVQGHWIEARRLKEGMILMNTNNEWLRIGNVVMQPRHTRVYNMEVKDANNYFANGILVHNANRYIKVDYIKMIITYTKYDFYYYVASNGSANWSTTSVWYGDSAHTVSLGIVPSSSDDVYIGAFSGTGTLTVDADASCKKLDMRGFGGTFAGATASLFVYGDCYIGRGTYTRGGYLYLWGTSDQNYNQGSATLGGHIGVSITGTLNLQTDLTIGSSNTIYYGKGNLNTNGHNITTGMFVFDHNLSKTLTITNSTINLKFNAGTCFTVANGTLTLNSSGSTIKFSASVLGYATVNFGSATWNNVEFAPASTSADRYFSIEGANTFNDFKGQVPGLVIKIPASTTQTITTLSTYGTVGGKVYIQSATPGTKGTLSMASGCPADNSVDYMYFTDIIGTGGASWYVGANSTLSNCTDLSAAACPVAQFNKVNTVLSTAIKAINSVVNASILKVNKQAKP